MNKQRRHWFPAMRYGFGWGLPVSWQGWVVFLVYLGLLLGAALMLSGPTDLLWFLPLVFLLTGLLLFIVWKTGEPPSWRWGDNK